MSECVSVSSCGSIFVFAPEHDVAQHRRVVLQWVPVHCGLPGNEKADELAKPGAKGRQQDNSVTFQEKKTLIRAALGQRTEREDFPLPRPVAAGCGHEIMHRPQPIQCPHVQHHHQPATAVLKTRRPNKHCRDAHFCRQQDKVSVWPTAIQLHTKPYGSKEELEKTATFILQTGL